MYCLDAYKPPENHRSAFKRAEIRSGNGWICLRMEPNLCPARRANSLGISSLMSRGCVWRRIAGLQARRHAAPACCYRNVLKVTAARDSLA